MNEVFETLAGVFEELRSGIGGQGVFRPDRGSKSSQPGTEKKQKAFEAYLSKLSKEDREF